ncbi:Carboxylesterase, type B [Sergentomyia squamirostris]
MTKFLYCVVIVLKVFAIAAVPSPEVCARDGCMRGKYESKKGRKPYEAFYGIPYAEPPVGKLRFENPVPYSGWSGYWDASYYRNDCYQKNYFLPNSPLSGAEDCLYLNVYRPSNWRNKKKLAVIVWIHGGAWVSFSSDPNYFGPDYFMTNEAVILVTMNYRLGLFGFLSSGDGAVKGNFGLKDQQLAMEWVMRNIEAFGGDSNSITLAGESAGAASANLHMLNPQSNRLFHKIILMSGAVTTPFINSVDYESQFRTAARSSGVRYWETASTYDIAQKLKQVDALTLVDAVDDLFTFILVPPGPLRNCIEGDWDGAFMTEDPRRIWAEGRYNQKPILIGTCLNEGIYVAILTLNDTLRQTFNENIYEWLPIQIDFNPRYASEVMKFYFEDKDYLDETTASKYFQMVGDRLFRYPLIKLVTQYLNYADVEENPVFIYEFGFQSNYTFLKYFTGTDINLGVSHLDDIIYVFSMPALFPKFAKNTPENSMSEMYVQTLVNFAQTGVVKKWRPFRPCTSSTSSFCDYQVFKRYTALDPDEVTVSVTNYIDKSMVNFWLRIDNGVGALNQKSCSNFQGR